MSKIVLNDVTNLNALSVINDNFDKLEQELQNKVLYRDNPAGEPNTLENDVDANGNSLYNIQNLIIDGAFTVQGEDVGAFIGQAADAAADAALSATAAANSATAANASAVAADTSADSADASEAVAITKASEASTSATNAASSATSAAGSATTATTQAGIATAQAVIATTKASEASTSASNAATSETNAASSATNAATSATSSASSASSAAASAAAAALALDNFDDRYLGSKTTAPTLDNDGNALVAGALYFNDGTIVSDDKGMYVYDGSQWIAASAASQAILTEYKFVATAGQAVFTGADANTLTLAYTPGSIIVTLNGSKLLPQDYTATSGTSLTLSVAASLNDELNIIAFATFDIANTYTQAQVDAFAVKLTGDQTIAGVKTFSGATTVMNGNVGIGTSSPTNFGSNFRLMEVKGSDFGVIQATSTSGSTTVEMMGASGSGAIGTRTNHPLLLRTNDTERARIDSSGNLLVGTTTAFTGTGFTFSPAGYGSSNRPSSAAQTMWLFYNGGSNVGEIRTSTTATQYLTSSDYRLKENILPLTGALAVVQQLKPVTYSWKSNNEQTQGFIAHELQEVVPECVAGAKDAVDEDGNPKYQSIDTSFLVATLTAAIQEQQAQIEQLKADVAALKGHV